MNGGRKRGRSRGFTYLGLLFLVSLMALTAAAASALWSVAKHRDDERQLVFVGRQFEAAIESYKRVSKDPKLQYPRELEQLLSDDRFPEPAHHLRRVFHDPMTGQAQWGLIRSPEGGIVGVYSLSVRKPFPRLNVTQDYRVPSRVSYRDWKFVAPSAREMVASSPQ